MHASTALEASTGGAAMLAGGAPEGWVVLAAALRSAGARGIITLSSLKSVEGDRRFGTGVMPVRLGPERAARAAMAVPRPVAAALLLARGAARHGAAVRLLLRTQFAPMARPLRAPRAPRAPTPWHSVSGLTPQAPDMLVRASAQRRPGAAAG